MLPIHLFTIVLNGEPFIRRHLDVFQKLPLRWHWHIIEGVADLKHDTAWSLEHGGRITDCLHNHGLSMDGTSGYLDELAESYPAQITIYRKPYGQFWDGKLEMVSTPLTNITEECLLWQVDVDECWSAEQIVKVSEMFEAEPQRTSAWYYCNFFVGPNLRIITRNTYGNNSSYEWNRTWHYLPGDRWASHEPPRLCRLDNDGNWYDLARYNPFLHAETESKGLIFEHLAYVAAQQLRFKEIYYGYTGAVESWERLQRENQFPLMLRHYFPWVHDGAIVDKAGLETRMPSIIWLRPDSIGDNILASSMLPHIRELYPKAKITVVCQDHIAALYEVCPYVDAVVSFNRKIALERDEYLNDLLEKIRSIRADILLNSVYSRDMLADTLGLGSAALHTIAMEGDLSNMTAEIREHHNHHYAQIVASPGANKCELERHRDFLAGLGKFTEELVPSAWITADDIAWVDKFFTDNGLKQEKTIVLFAGALHAVRLYERYGEALAPICSANEFVVVAIGSEEDGLISHRNLQLAGTRSLNLCGRTTIRQSAALLSRCRLAFGAETGVAHMACAVGTPNIVLLGGGHFGRFFPYSPLTSIVCLPLECYGCNWECKFGKPYCIQEILPEALSHAINESLNSMSPKPRIYVQPETSWKQSLGRPEYDLVSLNYIKTSVDVYLI